MALCWLLEYRENVCKALHLEITLLKINFINFSGHCYLSPGALFLFAKQDTFSLHAYKQNLDFQNKNTETGIQELGLFSGFYNKSYFILINRVAFCFSSSANT